MFNIFQFLDKLKREEQKKNYTHTHSCQTQKMENIQDIHILVNWTRYNSQQEHPAKNMVEGRSRALFRSFNLLTVFFLLCFFSSSFLSLTWPFSFCFSCFLILFKYRICRLTLAWKLDGATTFSTGIFPVVVVRFT